MKRTDKNPIVWPRKTSKPERVLVRKFTLALVDRLFETKDVVILCSAGLDSTVLAHVVHLTKHQYDMKLDVTLLYINHGLRVNENVKEIDHVKKLASDLSFNYEVVDGPIETDGNLQATARDVRYTALKSFLGNQDKPVVAMTAHHASDEAETRLFQFLTGRPTYGIDRLRKIGQNTLIRPLIGFTREDIKQYAELFDLTWCEDSTNATHKYTRNKLRHLIIPLIEKELNLDLTKILAR